MLRSGIGLVIAAVMVAPIASVEEKLEKQKIEALLKHIDELKDAKFIRNGTEHDAKAAAKYLRIKWERSDSQVKTARDFIEKVATTSSTSGKPYLIRLKDGKDQNLGEYLTAELKKIEKP